MSFVLAPSSLSEADAVLALYRSVAAIEGGLARTVDEIDAAYVQRFLTAASAGGAGLVARAENDGAIVGEIHCYSLGPKVFAHVLGELTVAVHPDWQGKGVGRALFVELLRRVRDERPDILRVELIARESNQKALAFYRSLGFVAEGRLEGRIRSVVGGFEADIPMAWRRDGA